MSYFQMARGWMDSDVFDDAPFTEREAWIWLIEQAAWRPTRARIKGQTINLERGDLCFAQRFMAEKWQWSKSRVDRFLKRLAAENMISSRSKIGATAGHSAGQGQSIITICNYEKYQSPKSQERGNAEPEIGATAGQQRGKEEELEEYKKEEKKEVHPRGGSTEYFFRGAVIRLNQPDFDRWRETYHAIPDLAAELTSLDAWLEDQPEAKRKKWFHTTAGCLNRKHQELLKAETGDEWVSPC